MLPLLLALLCAGPDTCTVTVVRASSPTWLEVTDDGESTWFVSIAGAAIVWHLDPSVPLPASDLVPGVRVRLTGEDGQSVSRIEIVSLGPLALAAAVEEFIAESCGRDPHLGLTPGEVATIDALGSPSYLVRSSVSRALRERRGHSLGLLMRARRHRDPEVRARAEGVLVGMGW